MEIGIEFDLFIDGEIEVWGGVGRVFVEVI